MSEAVAKKIKSAISIPVYVKTYINSEVDLDTTPKICCPFHDEDTPSFSYSKERGVARCFGKCKRGGDVIEIYRWHQKIPTRNEAILAMASMLGIDTHVRELTPVEIKIDERLLGYSPVLNKAIKLATSIEDYLDLDYIMSQHRSVDELKDDLELFINRRV